MCQEFTAENQGAANNTMFEFLCNGECAEADISFWYRFDVSPGISAGMFVLFSPQFWRVIIDLVIFLFYIYFIIYYSMCITELPGVVVDKYGNIFTVD